MESFVVIGLGRFGSAVAEKLCQSGHQVLAVDTDEKVVQQMADHVTQAVAGDCQDLDVLRALGVKDMSCAVVAFSNDIGRSILVTLQGPHRHPRGAIAAHRGGPSGVPRAGERLELGPGPVQPGDFELHHPH